MQSLVSLRIHARMAKLLTGAVESAGIPKTLRLEAHMRILSTVARRGKPRGQGMTEYIIIVALIAIAAIGVYSFFGQTVRQPPATTAPEQSGKVVTKENTAVQPAAGQGSAKPAETKGMGDNKGTPVNK